MNGTPVRNPAVVWRDEPDVRDAIFEAQERGEEVGDRGWVILVVKGVMHELNLLGGEIWCLADGRRDVDAIVASLAQCYDAPADEIRADVEEFLDDCAAKGWLSGKEG